MVTLIRRSDRSSTRRVSAMTLTSSSVSAPSIAHPPGTTLPCRTWGYTSATGSVPAAASRVWVSSSPASPLPAPVAAWYVATVTWRSPYARLIGASTMLSGIATQLGFATMPRWFASVAALTSGTTRGTAGSMRNALDLSTATPPAPATRGACRREVAAPAAKNTMSVPRNASSLKARTSMSPRCVVTWRPALFALANRCSSAAGNARSASTRTSVPPAAPVAPTMATDGRSALIVVPATPARRRRCRRLPAADARGRGSPRGARG